MPFQMTNFGENKLADFTRGQGLTLPTNWYIALGSAAAEGSFTEITGIGTIRATVPRSLAKWAGTQGAGTTLASTGTSHTTSNNDPVTFGTPTGSATASFVGFFDNSSGGNCWFYIPITPISITTGSPDPVSLAANALQIRIGALTCSDYLANKLIDLLVRGQAYPWPSPTFDALYTTAPTQADVGGAEVAGGSYARVPMTPSLTTLSGTQAPGSTTPSSGTGGRVSNNDPIVFPAMPAVTVVAVGRRDAASAGNLLFVAALATPKTMSAGATPTFSANTLGLTLD